MYKSDMESLKFFIGLCYVVLYALKGAYLYDTRKIRPLNFIDKTYAILPPPLDLIYLSNKLRQFRNKE